MTKSMNNNDNILSVRFYPQTDPQIPAHVFAVVCQVSGERASSTHEADRMPRDGAIIFGHLIGKLDVLRVACTKCERIA